VCYVHHDQVICGVSIAYYRDIGSMIKQQHDLDKMRFRLTLL